MSEHRYLVSWEMVTPFDWPEGYWCRAGQHEHEHPTVPKAEVPEEKWRRIEREYAEEAAARSHFEGLTSMDTEGVEFVRNPELHRAPIKQWETFA